MAREVTFDSEFEEEDPFEEEECIEWSLEGELDRTMAYIIDYKMFIAARRIQSFWRTHRNRELLHQRRQAAITIQRWWRGFRVRRQMLYLAERRVQEEFLAYLNLMATRIQALFRGWSHRRRVHDMVRLKRIQTNATEELILCLIQRLHRLKRTEYIPGYVSLLDTVCMPIIENLQTCKAFRFHNGRVTSMVASKKAREDEARRHFHDCRFETDIPYTGPNYTLCARETRESPSLSYDGGNVLLDPRLNDIAAEYQAFQRNEYLREWHNQSGSQKRKSYLRKVSEAKESFCISVFSSMQRWGVWNEFKVGVNDILKDQERRERFFRKLRLVLEEHGTNCSSMACGFPDYQSPEAHICAGRDG